MSFSLNRKRLFALLLALALVMSLSGCKKKSDDTGVTLDESLYSFSDEAQQSLSNVRKGQSANAADEALSDDGSDAEAASETEEADTQTCFVAYLGTADTSECYMSLNQELFSDILSENGYSDEYVFMDEITAFNVFESVDGCELFCIVPPVGTENVRIKIPQDNIVPDYVYSEDSIQLTMEPGDPDEAGRCTMYSRNNDDPVIICVNTASDTDEAWVTLTLSSGETISFSPSLRESDDHLNVEDGVSDFSLYASVPSVDDFTGEWMCREAEDELGNRRSISISFGVTDGVNEVFYSYSAIDGMNAGQELFSYVGTWEDAPSGMENYGEGCIVMYLNSTGGIYQEAGAPEHEQTGVFSISASEENPDEIIVRCVDGEPLVPGTLYQDLIFTRQ